MCINSNSENIVKSVIKTERGDEPFKLLSPGTAPVFHGAEAVALHRKPRTGRLPCDAAAEFPEFSCEKITPKQICKVENSECRAQQHKLHSPITISTDKEETQ